jgi:cbb3-type cytochrome oxidase subunit 3
MWGVIWSFMLAGAVYAYSNGRKQQEKEEKDVDMLDPAIDVEPVYENKKNK